MKIHCVQLQDRKLFSCQKLNYEIFRQIDGSGGRGNFVAITYFPNFALFIGFF